MQQFQVPQYINIEDRIIGPLTLKQFLILLATGGVIMFFYSNSEECKGSVEKDSFIITYLRNKHDSLRVYSYDIDLSSDIISILKKKYSVRGCQTIVVNGNSTLSNIENSQDFEKFLFS